MGNVEVNFSIYTGDEFFFGHGTIHFTDECVFDTIVFNDEIK